MNVNQRYLVKAVIRGMKEKTKKHGEMGELGVDWFVDALDALEAGILNALDEVNPNPR